MRGQAMRRGCTNRYPSLWAAIESIAPKIGCVSQTLHDWVRKHEIDTGVRDGVTSDERERLKTLEHENKDPPTRPMEDAGSGRTGNA